MTKQMTSVNKLVNQHLFKLQNKCHIVVDSLFAFVQMTQQMTSISWISLIAFVQMTKQMSYSNR